MRDVRADIQEQLDILRSARKLWQVFRAIICGTLQDLEQQIGQSASVIMQHIDERIHDFFCAESSTGYVHATVGIRIIGN